MPNSYDHISIEEAIKLCSQSERLSTWEKDFIESVAECAPYLTRKQIDCLYNIVHRIQRPTSWRQEIETLRKENNKLRQTIRELPNKEAEALQKENNILRQTIQKLSNEIMDLRYPRPHVSKFDYQKLAKILGYLGSDQDGEVLNAAKLAEKMRLEARLQWSDLFDLQKPR